jgi:hypothetical protein
MGYFTPQKLGGTRDGNRKMIDDIRLSIPRKTGGKQAKNLTEIHQFDTHTFNAKIGTMHISGNLGGYKIQGSIAKYLHGENMTPLVRSQVREAIEKLEADTEIDLHGAIVQSVECGATVITREAAAGYLRLFGNPAGLLFKPIYKAGLLQTVSYGTDTGSYQFCAYDKTAEMQKHKMPIPDVYSGAHALRLEYRIIKRRGIQAEFGRDLTAHDLYEHDIYRKLQSLFYDFYTSIPKAGRTVYVDTGKPLTPRTWQVLCAEQYRQSCPKEYNAYLQSMKADGAVTDKELERIRAQDRKSGNDCRISDKSPLIVELDEKVRIWARYGA